MFIFGKNIDVNFTMEFENKERMWLSLTCERMCAVNSVLLFFERISAYYKGCKMSMNIIGKSNLLIFRFYDATLVNARLRA